MSLCRFFFRKCLPAHAHLADAVQRLPLQTRFHPRFPGEMQRPWRHAGTLRDRGKLEGGGKRLISVRIPHNNAAMFGPRPQLLSSFIPPFAPSLYMRLLPLRSHRQFRREQFEKIGVKKWRNNARASRQMSAMSGRQQSLGGSSMADYQLPRSKSRFRKGSGGPSAKKKRGAGGWRWRGVFIRRLQMQTIQKEKPLFVETWNTLIMTCKNVAYFHVCSPWRKQEFKGSSTLIFFLCHVLVLILEDLQNSASLSLKTSSVSLVS